MIAVIKANAYGHGLATAAAALAGADAFAVARVAEAVALREAGCNARIVLLEGFGDAFELEAAARHSLEPFVHQPFQVELLEAWRGPQVFRAWLKVDTGMHRLGFAARDGSRRGSAARGLPVRCEAPSARDAPGRRRMRRNWAGARPADGIRRRDRGP